MVTMYEKYLKLNIEGSHIGLEYGVGKNNYFCTPKGASVIGWAGVDGIHFCFVRGFGEMVFAVSPMNTPGNYVHPLAQNFKDFLRLLLACGHTAALEQAWRWDQAQFDGFLGENAPTAEQSVALDIIREKLSLTPMDRPFTYIKGLQAGFDYRRIKYAEDYDDFVPAEPQMPEWKVYFDGNFCGHHGRERAGKEIPLNRKFVWEDEAWNIPAVYTCSKGLVIDFYLKVPLERIRAFMDKWKLLDGSDGTDFTDEQRMQIDAENPLAFNMNPKAVLNGTGLLSSHGCGLSWNPCFPEGNGLEAQCVVQHYGLDPDQGYAIWRSAFLWKTHRKPQIKTLRVILAQDPIAISGPHFQVSLPGEQIEFTHPSTGQKYTLTVEGYERREFSARHFNVPTQEFPEHYTMLSYTILPAPPDGFLTITDCAPSDRPRQKHPGPNVLQATNEVCSIGIIGIPRGATSTASGGGNEGKLQAACSALHFEPVDAVEWRIVFHEKRCEDIGLELI
ncbi:MAG TPA: hypothetical protein GXX75_01385 [Clostridiales bacterium]|nr:hypothetical protein [Clostridiales bacterium]